MVVIYSYLDLGSSAVSCSAVDEMEGETHREERLALSSQDLGNAPSQRAKAIDSCHWRSDPKTRMRSRQYRLVPLWKD